MSFLWGFLAGFGTFSVFSASVSYWAMKHPSFVIRNLMAVTRRRAVK